MHYELRENDIVESVDWRDHGKKRRVTSVPKDGPHKGYCFLQSRPGGFSTRVRLRKNGEPERYRLLRNPLEE